jgi:Ca2+-dependent lipid-binding protein
MIEVGKPPSSYTEQYLVAPLKSRQRAGVIKSETYSGSTHPKWFEEAIFSVRDRRLPMRLQVWDSKFIVSDKLLSHIQMDLRSLQPHQLYDIWLPLIVRIHNIGKITSQRNFL